MRPGKQRWRVRVFLGFMLLAGSAWGQMLESFETWQQPPGQSAPPGWRKWQEAGGRGWSNTWVGRQPMPGWMSGTNEAPPDPDTGSRMAYVTYTHGGAKTNDLWLISPTLKGMTATSTVSFWYRSSFSNFADNVYLMVSTNTNAYRKSDFTIEAYHRDFPRAWPTGDFMDWTNVVVDVGSLVPTGTPVRIALWEYCNNNWYDVRANELDVIRSDLWAEPVLQISGVRLTDPTTIAVDYNVFPGYPTGTCYLGWSPDPATQEIYQAVALAPGTNSCVITNLSNVQTLYIRPFADHPRAGRTYGDPVTVHSGDSDGEGFLFESFEDWPLTPGQTAPAGWRKWQEAGGRGWSNIWVGRQPMPGWMSGTNQAPPDPDAGNRMAYVTYTHGGGKTNDLWLISPTIRNVPSSCPVSFWYRSSFSNFADNVYLMVSTNPAASRKSDFTIEAYHRDFPRGWPTGDFMDWTNVVVDIGALVTPGADVRIGFNEYCNNNWYDVRANELDVVRVGSRVRNALRFDGVDDSVRLPLTNRPTAYTLEAWVKPEAIGAMSIAAATDGDPLTTYSRQLRLTAGGAFEHYLWDGTARTVTGTTVAQTGRWYHVCGTATNSGPMRLYVNGVEEGTAATIGTTSTARTNVVLGGATGGGFGPFAGWIDEVRTWTVVRTPTEIQDAMNLYLRGIETGLESCYRLDSTWGTNVFDASTPADDACLTGGATDPQWGATETPLGDYLAAQRWSNRGVWQMRTNADAGRGLELSSAIAVATNFLVAGDNNLSGASNRTIAGGAMVGVLKRIWYLDVHGATQQVAELAFDPATAGITLLPTELDSYLLLRGDSPTGTFAAVRTAADRLAGGVAFFDAVAVDEGCYTLGLGPPPPPTALSATGIAAHVFWANWGAVSNVTGYQLDVGTNAAFGEYAPGFENRALGLQTTAAVTGLLPGVTYHFRVRAERDGVASSNSTTVAVTTLTEGAIGIEPATLNFNCTYGTSPAAQTFVLTNSGETAYAYSNAVAYYSPGASGWLTAMPSGSVAAGGSAGVTASVSAASVNAGSYWATSQVLSATATNSPQNQFVSLTVAKADQTINFPAIGDQETTNEVGLAATASSGLGVSFAVGAGPGSIAGGTNLTFTGAGTVSIVASQGGDTNWNAAPAATNTFNVTKATASVYLLDLAQVYDGTARTVAATTLPAGLTVELTYDGDTWAPTNVGSYAVTGTIDDVIYQGAATGTLGVAKADQAITFPAIADQETTNEVVLAASATSGLEVSFAVDSGPGAIAGGTNLTFSTSGQVSIVASQAGDSNWNAAPNATNSLHVAKATASVYLLDLEQTFDGAAHAISATSLPAGLMIEFTYDGGTAPPTNAGTYAVTGSVVDLMYQGTETGSLIVARALDAITFSDTNHVYDGTGKAATAVAASGSPVDLTYAGTTNLPVNAGTYAVTGIVDAANWEATNATVLTIVPADQTIAFPAIGDQETTNEVGLAATASSGLGVSFAVGAGPGSIAGGTNLTFTGAGTVSIVASQGGDTNWNAAPAATNTFHVAKATAPVYLLDLAQVYDGTARTVAATTLPAGLTVELTYDGDTWAPTNVGSYAVTGTIDDAIYQGAATGTLGVAKADQAITFPAIADQETTNEVVLAASATSGLEVSFAVGSGPGAIAGGTNLTFSTSGQVSIVASQAGNSNWNPAPNATNSFHVAKATASVYLLDIAQVYDGTARTVSATTLPAGLTVEFTYAGNAWAPTNAGSYAVTGMVDDVVYQGVATGALAVARALDAITFSDTNHVYDGTGKAATAVAASGSPVDLTYAGTTNLPVNAGTYAVTGIVDAANWEATNATVLTIVKADQIVTNFLPPDGAHFVLGASTTVSAQASSGLAVSFVNLAPEIADLAGTTITFTNVGLARVRAEQAGDANWNAAAATNAWRAGGMITNVAPAAANVGGGIAVVIQGQWLGDGTDITNVTLAAVEAAIVTQGVDEVTVTAGVAPGAATGDVRVASASGGLTVLGDAFEYLWLDAPVQLDPIAITPTNLVARWELVPAASRHVLDAGTDTNFAAYVPGYEKLDVALAEQYPVEGLADGTWYALRVFAWNASGYSWPSRTVWVPTGTNTPYETHPPLAGPVSQGATMDHSLSNMFHGAGMVYAAASSDTNVMTVAVGAGGRLLMHAVGPGTAEITVSATDPATGYVSTYSFAVTVVGAPALDSAAFLPRELWNPRFTQALAVRNDSGLDAIGVRVLFTNLMAGIVVENQTGTSTDGRPMIEMETAFANGATLALNVVYLCTGAYRVDTYPPTLELQYILPEWTAPLPGAGTMLGEGFALSGGRYAIQFDSVVGRLYAIEYRNNFPGGEWVEVPLRLRATANQTQWIDAGPPATQPPEGLRVYRVKEVNE